MFSVLILFILNLQKSTATHENNESILTQKNTYGTNEKETTEFYEVELDYIKNMDLSIKQSIIGMIYDVVLEKMRFSILMQHSWPKELDENEYEIRKEDIYFNFFMQLKSHSGDINFLSCTQLAVSTLLLALHKNISKLYIKLLNFIFLGIKVNVNCQGTDLQICINKMNEENNLCIEQVFKNDVYEKLDEYIIDSNIEKKYEYSEKEDKIYCKKYN
ncbi:uncharacterized protein VNE69_05070 [Vairimorpha necatrix]|uniref:Uncharacterized protein n=1 Tax=Vairimorpha necatrix TaxID=6039 RepID=A0AAX4JCB6_9MICR